MGFDINIAKIVFLGIFVVSFISVNIPILLVLYFATLKQTKSKRKKIFWGYFLLTIPMFLFLILSIFFK